MSGKGCLDRAIIVRYKLASCYVTHLSTALLSQISSMISVKVGKARQGTHNRQDAAASALADGSAGRLKVGGVGDGGRGCVDELC